MNKDLRLQISTENPFDTKLTHIGSGLELTTLSESLTLSQGNDGGWITLRIPLSVVEVAPALDSPRSEYWEPSIYHRSFGQPRKDEAAAYYDQQKAEQVAAEEHDPLPTSAAIDVIYAMRDVPGVSISYVRQGEVERLEVKAP